MDRSRRSYFLLLGLACAVGWSTGLWAVPLLAFAGLELGWTLAERAGTLRKSLSAGSTVAFAAGGLEASSGEVEVERVQ